MSLRVYRIVQGLLLWLSAIVVAGSFYFQYVLNFLPCPLCLMQRLCACLILCLTLIAVLQRRVLHIKKIAYVQVFCTGFGLYFACRQLWLQSMPVPDGAACMPGIEMLIHLFPWQQLLQIFLWGSNACSEVAWTALGLTMAAWSALYFSFVLGVVLFILLNHFLRWFR